MSKQDWTVTANNGVTLTAENITTGETYSGSTSGFQALFPRKATSRNLLATSSEVFKLPPGELTLTLTSTNAGKALELSTDGVNFFTPSFEVSDANTLVTVVGSTVFVVRCTGNVGDVFTVLGGN